MEKVTKRERYEEIRKILEENEKAELVEFIDHELELLAKKNASRSNKPSKSALVTVNVAEAVRHAMVNGEYYTATDLIKLIKDDSVSNQRMTSALKILIDSGIVLNEKKKGKSFFYLA